PTGWSPRGARGGREPRRGTSRGRRRAATRSWIVSDDLVQLPGGHVEHESAHRVLLRDERARLDARDRLADVGVEVAERLRRPGWLEAGLLLDRRLEAVVGEGE